MKEYKTLQVYPQDETFAIEIYEKFGWQLENTREVYSESQGVTGATTSFDVDAGRAKTNVQSQKNVTHYISMRFSRDTSIKNYLQLKELEKEFDSIKYLDIYDLPKFPAVITIIGLVGFASIVLPFIAAVCIAIYLIRKCRIKKLNSYAKTVNSKARARAKEILNKAEKLYCENNAA